MRNHIKLIGCELEGRWNKTPHGGEGFKDDGSLVFDDDYECDCCSGNCDHGVDEGFCECRCDPNDNVGELPSRPLKLKALLDWIDRHYPDDVNDTCGFHVHISFYNKLDYAKIMDNDFFEYFYGKLEEFGKQEHIDYDPFWSRLEGENDYCGKSRNMFSNMWLKACYRTAINVYAFHSHGTVELRLLPMFDKKEVALKAVKYVHDIINDYLNVHNKREKSRMIKICV